MTFDELLAGYDDAVQAIARRARALVFDAAPGAVETVSASYRNVSYGHEAGRTDAFCYIAPFKGHVNLGFMAGADLPDPAGLLEGTGKNMRHVKLKRAADVDAPALRALVEAAAGAAA